MNVGTSPVSIGQSAQLVQNLGPDDLYIQASSSVTSSTGFRIPTGKAVSVAFSNGSWYVISSGTSEVRSLAGGTGSFDASSA